MTVVALLFGICLAGCAGQNPLLGTGGKSGVAGFWAGLWHGLTLGPAFILSLIRSDVSLYEVHNSGHLYDLGYLMGVCTGAAMLARSREEAARSPEVLADPLADAESDEELDLDPVDEDFELYDPELDPDVEDRADSDRKLGSQVEDDKRNKR